MFLTTNQRILLNNALRDSGIFVSCGKAKPNLMSTHWGSLGNFWNRQIFILPVRSGKLSYEVIESEKTFAISVPTTDMSREIMMCDHMSGYTVNKFDALHLHPKRARKIDAYVLGDCGLIIECKVLFSCGEEFGYIDESLKNEMYADKAFHTMYFAEVIDCYEHKEKINENTIFKKRIK